MPGLNDLPYEERLRTLRLPKLTYRRIRGDMIQTFKIINNKYDYNPEILFGKRSAITSDRTRGHGQMLFKKRAQLNIKKHSFSFRTVDIWNSLPPSVGNAQSVRAFESRLDRLWNDQEIKYNYKSTVVTGLNILYIDENEELVSQE